MNRLRQIFVCAAMWILVCTSMLTASDSPDPQPAAPGPYDFLPADAGEGEQPCIVEQILYPDGRILGRGYYETRQEERTLLVRWLADGRLDTSFGHGGVATLNNPGGNIPHQFALDSKGRILVTALYYKDDPGARTGNVRNPGVIFRFTPDGHLDPSWGKSGVVTVDAVVRQTKWTSWMGVAVLPDDRVAIAYIHFHEAHARRGGPDTHKLALLLLDENGAPDPSFGTEGVAIPDTAEPLHITGIRLLILNDKRFLVYGAARTHLATPPDHQQKAFFAVFTPEGEWDKRVGNGKGYTLHLLGEDAQAASVTQVNLTGAVELRNGQILASGYWLSPGLDRKFDSFVVRYLPDGSLDKGFGGRNLGYTEIIRTTNPDWAFSISALRNGNPVVAGTSSQGGYLLQLNANGTQILWRQDLLSKDGVEFRHAMDANGRFFITGGRASDPDGMSIRKFNASGAPDTRFGRTRDGIVRVFVRRGAK